MASKIRVLDELVANQIAAGEVIERPASVVKELLENSLDAGSTRIQAEISEGGRKSIRILDNGVGIFSEDVSKAFLRHATSKLEKARDLFSIRTLGFRGEALSSIATVSQVTVKTRTAEEPVGTFLKIKGGEIIEERQIGMAVGTDFLVEDLFFNTPARYKYLKTVTTELGQISDIFNRIALAKPEVSMSLAHNGRVITQTPGNNRLQDTILSIYGRELVDSLLEISYEANYVQVSGFITTPVVYRSSRKHQSFFVNGRYVQSTLLSKGVDEGFVNILPPNRYPIVFLFIKINPIHVDVNVHPTKLQVKFSRPEIVQEVVAQGMKKALKEADHLPEFKPLKRILHQQQNLAKPAKSLFQFDQKEEFVGSLTNTKVDNTGIEASIEASVRTDASAGANTSVNNLEIVELPNKAQYEQLKSSDVSKVEFAQPEVISDRSEAVFQSEKNYITELLPIGQIHQTFIVAEAKDGFYVIDQHIAHERVLYEELMKSFRENGLPSQKVLLPLTLELTFKEVQAIRENLQLFDRLGFEVEEFGGQTVIIRAVPKRIDQRPDKALFLEIVDLILEEKTSDRARLYDQLITTLSCKGAIKAGEFLEHVEMVKLLADLSKTENPRFCPHGRPILFHISERDLLKAFQRI